MFASDNSAKSERERERKRDIYWEREREKIEP
jgi:hypothetical protein